MDMLAKSQTENRTPLDTLSSDPPTESLPPDLHGGLTVAVVITMIVLTFAGLALWNQHREAELFAKDLICAEYAGSNAEDTQNQIEARFEEFHRNAAKTVLLVISGFLVMLVAWPCLLIKARKRAAARKETHNNITRINRQLADTIERTNRMVQKATDANKAKSDFLANMSHEIRTPMNAIVGFAEVLADGKLNAEQAGHVAVIKDSARSLLETVNDILDISKIEAGKLDVQIGPCRLDQLLNQIESMMRPQAEANGLEFEVLKNASLPLRIETDALRLRQCLVNLVGNAIKFTRKGHVYINANLQQDNAKAFIRFDVEDTGVGISRKDRAAVFESFVQARGTEREFGGTGLGLTITKELARLLGGKLTLTSELQKGSVFSLLIPAGDDVTLETVLTPRKADTFDIDEHIDPADTKLDVVEKVDAGAVEFRGKVLVTEDTPSSQMLIKLLLEKMGFDVTIAKDGLQAVEKTEKHRYDLIFMDIHMPNMNGYDATRTLRSNGIATPIIALTANAMKGDDRKCLAAGCDDYLTKPIDRKRLLCVLQKYLDPVTIAITPNNAQAPS